MAVPPVADGAVSAYLVVGVVYARADTLNRIHLSRPALDEDATFALAALDVAVDITGGCPYFIQELGYAVWTVAEGPEITEQDVRAAVPAYDPSSTRRSSGCAWIEQPIYNAPTCVRWQNSVLTSRRRPASPP